MEDIKKYPTWLRIFLKISIYTSDYSRLQVLIGNGDADVFIFVNRGPGTTSGTGKPLSKCFSNGGSLRYSP